MLWLFYVSMYSAAVCLFLLCCGSILLRLWPGCYPNKDDFSTEIRLMIMPPVPRETSALLIERYRSRRVRTTVPDQEVLEVSLSYITALWEIKGGLIVARLSTMLFLRLQGMIWVSELHDLDQDYCSSSIVTNNAEAAQVRSPLPKITEKPAWSLPFTW